MDFTKELTSFPTAVHREIYFAARCITPPETALAGIDDEEFCLSAKKLYDFVITLLSDMYDEPAMYHIFPGEYEAFMNGHKETAMKQMQPSKCKAVIAHVRGAVARYMLLLCFLGELGVPENGGIRISDEAYGIIEKAVNTSTHPVCAEKRFAALSRVGIIYSNGFCKLPDDGAMFTALATLAAITKKKHSGFPYFAFENLDFRVMNPKFKPGYQDYLRPLISSRYEFAVKLHNNLTAIGCRPTINTFWKIDYKYKGSQVMCVDTMYGELKLQLVETYSWDNPAQINSRLERETPEQQKYALRRLWRCTACSTTHIGVVVTVLGHRQRVCGGGLIGFRWWNPDEDEFDAIMRYVNYRCEIIRELSET